MSIRIPRYLNLLTKKWTELLEKRIIIITGSTCSGKLNANCRKPVVSKSIQATCMDGCTYA